MNIADKDKKIAELEAENFMLREKLSSLLSMAVSVRTVIEPALILSNSIENMIVTELEVTVRTINTLRAEGIHTVKDLLKKSQIDLLRLPNFGKKSLTEVMDSLSAKGLWLREK